MVPRAQADGLWESAVLAAAGGVGAIVFAAWLGEFSSGGVKGTVSVIVAIAVHLLASIVGFRAAQAWFRSAPRADSFEGAVTLWRNKLAPWLNAAAALCLPYFVLPVEAVVAWRRIGREPGDLVPHPGDAKRVESEYLKATSAWQERIARFEATERKRVEGLDVWYPVLFSASPRVTCVFGGTSVSWTAVLTTLGVSLLGSGDRVLIGDLSRRLTADVLCDMSRTMGIPTAEAVLPSSSVADLFAGMNWNDLSTVLVEVLHSAQRDPDASRRDREADRSVIRDVAECLEASGPVSITRLRRALLVVQGGDAAGNAEVVLDDAERGRLTELFNATQRTHGGVMERVTRIERALRDFKVLDRAGLQHGEGDGNDLGERSAGASARRGQLRVISVEKRIDDLESDRLGDLLFQLLLRRVRHGLAHADVLIVLGADRIHREALESLVAHADRSSIAVVLLFEHLRQDAIEIIGVGGAAAAFMALGNHREAREASEFIGAEYKWIESQHTASASRSLTCTPGRQESTSTSGTLGVPLGGSLGRSKISGRSYTEAFGQSVEYAVGDERVREAVVEPEVLMRLPVTGMIRVEVLPDGRRNAINVDCHPAVASSARVAGVAPASAAARTSEVP
jgi:hypothetical protein